MNKIHGIIAINKSAGMTSHDVVSRIRRITGVKKVGHAGTLDPDATGLLLVAIGHGTRLTEYLLNEDKSYRAECVLGISTTTEDATGDIVEQVSCELPSDGEIIKCLKSFVGIYEQTPPMYSAIKIGGVPLYKFARYGKERERASRLVNIYDISLLTDTVEQGYPRFTFDVSCSKGTYIRTLCVDIGQKLGLPAHMSWLVRTKIGDIQLENSFTLDEVEELYKLDGINKALISMNDVLPGLKEIVVDNQTISDIIYNGKELKIENSNVMITDDELIKIIDGKEQLVALYKLTADNKFMPVKVFKYCEYGEDNAG